ncbi:methyltransferase domain-containing protein [Paeniglutamicibacter antarcticus]|uniref:Methyltransferase domain-containing protein n=1 Tax=Arthrobacter terrae TaxID=2935737 RepID=A0A931CP35_9MICC|nr:class I SAM-dependent methyltransferase [Arthrobacter terrae]MBG0740055.1 methyltransferase domain-containing protein [Arthrobacter terrae]
MTQTIFMPAPEAGAPPLPPRLPKHPGTALFGQGSSEPYARALGRKQGLLTLRPLSPEAGLAPVTFAVDGWCAPATTLERSLVSGLGGPLLDIGCGPGRLLAAAASLGITAMGLDTSTQAVQQALERGTRAVRQSVFETVQHTGRWRSAVLLDGNIGIGGSVNALLRRSRELLSPDGTLLVEVDPDDDVDAAFQAVLEDDDGKVSEPFRWARAGRTALATRAAVSGWELSATRRVQDRVFCWLTPARLNRRPARRSSR